MDLKTPVLAAAALAALIAGGPAAAQNSGWYLGGGPSASKADFEPAYFDALVPGATRSSDDADVAPRVFGGYRISSNWGVEFGLTVLGRFKHRYNAGASGNAVFNWDASAATAALAGSLPLGAGLSLNGRLGVALTAARIELSSATGTVATNLIASGWGFFSDRTAGESNLYWGAGVQYDINPRWGVRLDYDNYGKVGDTIETGRAKMDAWSANVLFRF
jgi:opacity protein-like surface antigen